ncbi:sigma factor-like helix-turn-helix DNA-binding protein [Sorangium sp. So ce542]|uniref:sigma factor-like helix-turn-helix DNA-binding protein n=1 Tax=Sorangium sp. So ce542 TaxID=3133316 RepID=UPI003F622C5A
MNGSAGGGDRPPLAAAAPAGGEEEAAVARLFEAGRAAWPALRVDAAAFARHVARHLPRGGAPAASLAALHAEDLYLACACAERVPGAVEAFEARHGAEVDAALRGHGASPAQREELRQALWEKIFVGRPGSPPKIADYSGRGALGGWVRVAAVRAALNLVAQAGAREVACEAARLPEPAGLDPELAFLKERYRAELKQALEDAVAALPRDQRNVLRLYFLEGLGIDRIAAVYGVHRATAARWVTRDREAVLRGTRQLLLARLRIDAEELDSLIALVRSQVELSLGGLLGPSEG